ncbi:hypothetical protein ACJ73_04865 [Blastomyces percursus]|uniref:Uncharacterized protein n=1 Tax=Blastomyces percursus TaxID=1658174 RepID=A0A1J9Q6T7_9EURO|nr:hypothetical protein ACJ73_04865 [Blastomyces percursus]
MSMGGTILAYNHAQPLVVERPVVTVLDDETDSSSFSRNSPSSHTSLTSYTSTQSDCPRSAKRQRTNSYNPQHSGYVLESGNAGIFSASRKETQSCPSTGSSCSSSFSHVVGRYNGALAGETDIQSAISSKSGLFSLVKYPWDNNPIAVSIWLAQKIDSTKKNQSSRSRMPDLEQNSRTSNVSQRPRRRRSRVRNDDILYPVGRIHCSGTDKFREYISKHKDESQILMNIECLHGERSPSVDSFSTKSFHCQMDLEARRIAPRLSKLQCFKPGFGDRLFGTMADNRCIDADTAAAGKLVVDVLATLIYPELPSECQASTDALIKVLDMESSRSPRFAKAFAILSNDPDVTKAVRLIVAQINSCGFSLGLDGEYEAFSELSNYHSPKASHSPQCVNAKQQSMDTSTLGNHLDSPHRRPSTSSTLSSSSYPSGHYLPESTPAITTSVSFENQNRTVPGNIRSSKMAPRQSTRVRKPTLRAIEAQLSSQAKSGTRARVPKASKKFEFQSTQAEENAVADGSKESNAAKGDIDAANKEASDPIEAGNPAPASSNRPMTPRSIDEVAAMARLDALAKTPACAQPTDETVGRPIDETAAAASLDSVMETGADAPRVPDQQPSRLCTSTTTMSPLDAPATSAPSPSSRALSSETDAMTDQLLDLATAASKPDFKPAVEIDLHRARRDWYAEQLAAALNKAAAEKPMETETARTSEETVLGESPFSSQPTPSVANAPSLATGVATPATSAEDCALGASGQADSADVVVRDTNASASVAAVAISSVQPNDIGEQTNFGQPSPMEGPVSDEAVEHKSSTWPTSITDKKFLDPSVLSHPYLPRPWTDSDGWVHTGRGNQHNEENVIIPTTYTWFRPRDSFNNPRIAPSPPQIKSLIQIELDDAFGYPPQGRKPNLPEDLEGPFVAEDVALETERAKIFRAARMRGIVIDRSMPLEDIQLAIEIYDEICTTEEAASSASGGNEIGKVKTPAKPSGTSTGTSKRVRASWKRAAASQSLKSADPKKEEDNEPTANVSKTTGNRKRRLNIDAPIPESSSAGDGSGSSSLADPESMEVDSKHVLLAPRGPGRPSKRAAAIATNVTTRKAAQPCQRRKRAARQTRPEPIAPAASETVADGPANDASAAGIEDSAAQKDAASTTTQVQLR